MNEIYPELEGNYEKKSFLDKIFASSVNRPQYLIVHHVGGTDANPLLDTSNQSFETVNAYHKIAFDFKSSLGYYIGYHYYISKNGILRQGRLDTDEGAHTLGYNNKSIGICLAGNFDAKLPTPEQTSALKILLEKKKSQYNIPSQNIVAHRMFANKTCFGRKLSDTWASSLVVDTNPNSSVKNELRSIIERLEKLEKII